MSAAPPAAMDDDMIERFSRAHRDLQDDLQGLQRVLQRMQARTESLLHHQKLRGTMHRFPVARPEPEPLPPWPVVLGAELTGEVLRMCGGGRDEILALRGVCVGCKPPVDAVRAEVVYVLGGVSEDGLASNQAERFDPRKGSWKEVPVLPFARAGSVAGVLRGKVYLCGGIGERGQLVNRYNPKLRKWEDSPAITRLGSPRFAASAVAIGGRLYVCGGENDIAATVHRTVEVFDPTRSTSMCAWETLPAKMTQGRRHLAAAVVEGPEKGLLVCGGAGFSFRKDYDHKGELALTSAEVLNLSNPNSAWRPLEPMRIGRAAHGAAGWRGGLLVAGGHASCLATSAICDVEWFDPEVRAWFPQPSIPVPRYVASMVCAGGNVYVLGGRSDFEKNGVKSSCMCFDEGKWTFAPDMLLTRMAFSAVAVKVAALAEGAGGRPGV